MELLILFECSTQHLTIEMLSWTFKEKFHISKQLGIILFII